MDIIDGYCHCGINKYRPIEDVNRVMDQFGVSRAVLVQHLGEYDNTYIGKIINAQPHRFAGVRLVDVNGDLSVMESDGFKGVRLIARTLQTHAHVWQHAAQLGLNFVIYDEPTIADHVAALSAFAKQHPDNAIIISHLGMLRRDLEDHRRILDLAEANNVYVQISGMHMFGAEPYSELAAIIKRFIKAFGSERLYYGSNFPVMGEDALYGREFGMVANGALGVRGDGIEDVLSRTAAKLWFT